MALARANGQPVMFPTALPRMLIDCGKDAAAMCRIFAPEVGLGVECVRESEDGEVALWIGQHHAWCGTQHTHTTDGTAMWRVRFVHDTLSTTMDPPASTQGFRLTGFNQTVPIPPQDVKSVVISLSHILHQAAHRPSSRPAWVMCALVNEELGGYMLGVLCWQIIKNFVNNFRDTVRVTVLLEGTMDVPAKTQLLLSRYGKKLEQFQDTLNEADEHETADKHMLEKLILNYPLSQFLRERTRTLVRKGVEKWNIQRMLAGLPPIAVESLAGEDDATTQGFDLIHGRDNDVTIHCLFAGTNPYIWWKSVGESMLAVKPNSLLSNDGSLGKQFGSLISHHHGIYFVALIVAAGCDYWPGIHGLAVTNSEVIRAMQDHIANSQPATTINLTADICEAWDIIVSWCNRKRLVVPGDFLEFERGVLGFLLTFSYDFSGGVDPTNMLHQHRHVRFSIVPPATGMTCYNGVFDGYVTISWLDENDVVYELDNIPSSQLTRLHLENTANPQQRQLCTYAMNNIATPRFFRHQPLSFVLEGGGHEARYLLEQIARYVGECSVSDLASLRDVSFDVWNENLWAILKQEPKPLMTPAPMMLISNPICNLVEMLGRHRFFLPIALKFLSSQCQLFLSTPIKMNFSSNSTRYINVVKKINDCVVKKMGIEKGNVIAVRLREEFESAPTVDIPLPINDVPRLAQIICDYVVSINDTNNFPFHSFVTVVGHELELEEKDINCIIMQATKSKALMQQCILDILHQLLEFKTTQDVEHACRCTMQFFATKTSILGPFTKRYPVGRRKHARPYTFEPCLVHSAIPSSRFISNMNSYLTLSTTMAARRTCMICLMDNVDDAEQASGIVEINSLHHIVCFVRDEFVKNVPDELFGMDENVAFIILDTGTGKHVWHVLDHMYKKFNWILYKLRRSQCQQWDVVKRLQELCLILAPSWCKARNGGADYKIGEIVKLAMRATTKPFVPARRMTVKGDTIMSDGDDDDDEDNNNSNDDDDDDVVVEDDDENKSQSSGEVVSEGDVEDVDVDNVVIDTSTSMLSGSAKQFANEVMQWPYWHAVLAEMESHVATQPHQDVFLHNSVNQAYQRFILLRGFENAVLPLRQSLVPNGQPLRVSITGLYLADIVSWVRLIRYPSTIDDVESNNNIIATLFHRLDIRCTRWCIEIAETIIAFCATHGVTSLTYEMVESHAITPHDITNAIDVLHRLRNATRCCFVLTMQSREIQICWHANDARPHYVPLCSTFGFKKTLIWPSGRPTITSMCQPLDPRTLAYLTWRHEVSYTSKYRSGSHGHQAKSITTFLNSYPHLRLVPSPLIVHRSALDLIPTITPILAMNGAWQHGHDGHLRLVVNHDFNHHVTTLASLIHYLNSISSQSLPNHIIIFALSTLYIANDDFLNVLSHVLSLGTIHARVVVCHIHDDSWVKNLVTATTAIATLSSAFKFCVLAPNGAEIFISNNQILTNSKWMESYKVLAICGLTGSMEEVYELEKLYLKTSVRKMSLTKALAMNENVTVGHLPRKFKDTITLTFYGTHIHHVMGLIVFDAALRELAAVCHSYHVTCWLHKNGINNVLLSLLKGAWGAPIASSHDTPPTLRAVIEHLPLLLAIVQGRFRAQNSPLLSLAKRGPVSRADAINPQPRVPLGSVQTSTFKELWRAIVPFHGASRVLGNMFMALQKCNNNASSASDSMCCLLSVLHAAAYHYRSQFYEKLHQLLQDEVRRSKRERVPSRKDVPKEVRKVGNVLWSIGHSGGAGSGRDKRHDISLLQWSTILAEVAPSSHHINPHYLSMMGTLLQGSDFDPLQFARLLAGACGLILKDVFDEPDDFAPPTRDAAKRARTTMREEAQRVDDDDDNDDPNVVKVKKDDCTRVVSSFVILALLQKFVTSQLGGAVMMPTQRIDEIDDDDDDDDDADDNFELLRPILAQQWSMRLIDCMPSFKISRHACLMFNDELNLIVPILLRQYEREPNDAEKNQMRKWLKNAVGFDPATDKLGKGEAWGTWGGNNGHQRTLLYALFYGAQCGTSNNFFSTTAETPTSRDYCFDSCGGRLPSPSLRSDGVEVHLSSSRVLWVRRWGAMEKRGDITSQNNTLRGYAATMLSCGMFTPGEYHTENLHIDLVDNKTKASRVRQSSSTRLAYNLDFISRNGDLIHHGPQLLSDSSINTAASQLTATALNQFIHGTIIAAVDPGIVCPAHVGVLRQGCDWHDWKNYNPNAFNMTRGQIEERLGLRKRERRRWHEFQNFGVHDAVTGLSANAIQHKPGADSRITAEDMLERMKVLVDMQSVLGTYYCRRKTIRSRLWDFNNYKAHVTKIASTLVQRTVEASIGHAIDINAGGGEVPVYKLLLLWGDGDFAMGGDKNRYGPAYNNVLLQELLSRPTISIHRNGTGKVCARVQVTVIRKAEFRSSLMCVKCKQHGATVYHPTRERRAKASGRIYQTLTRGLSICRVCNFTFSRDGGATVAMVMDLMQRLHSGGVGFACYDRQQSMPANMLKLAEAKTFWPLPANNAGNITPSLNVSGVESWLEWHQRRKFWEKQLPQQQQKGNVKKYLHKNREPPDGSSGGGDGGGGNDKRGMMEDVEEMEGSSLGV